MSEKGSKKWRKDKRHRSFQRRKGIFIFAEIKIKLSIRVLLDGKRRNKLLAKLLLMVLGVIQRLIN